MKMKIELRAATVGDFMRGKIFVNFGAERCQVAAIHGKGIHTEKEYRDNPNCVLATLQPLSQRPSFQVMLFGTYPVEVNR